MMISKLIIIVCIWTLGLGSVVAKRDFSKDAPHRRKAKELPFTSIETLPPPRPTRCGRIFQIGFNKCGTVSLSRFFAENGVPAVHYDKGRLGRTMEQRYRQGKPLIDEEIYSRFRFFSDFEFFDMDTGKHFSGHKELWRELDDQYPDSLFILNVRNRDDWIRSRLRHGKPPGRYVSFHMQSHNLSTVREVVQLWERQWDEHLAAVQEHFKDRSDTLLVLNITDPNAGEQLAGFVQRCFLGRFDPSRFLHYHGTAPNILEGRCQHEPSEDVCYKAGSIPVGRRVSQRKEKRNKRHHPHLSRWANNQHGRKNHRKKKPNWMIIKGSQDRRNLQRLVSKEGEVISIDIGYKGFKRAACLYEEGSPQYFFHGTTLRC